MTKDDKSALLAWGYYSAAIRGEIPPVVNEKRVREWLAGTQMCRRVAPHRREQWISQVVPHVLRVLEEEWGVVRKDHTTADRLPAL